MPKMLPSTPKTFGDIRHVFSSAFSAVQGEANYFGFKPVKQAVVILVDGLGAHNLRARAGHSGFMANLINSQKTISCGFPSTTATSLTSIATGENAGAHGIIGYRIQNPGSKDPVNMLSGWASIEEAVRWKLSTTISEHASATDVRVNFIGAPEYRNSGFTQLTFPGANFLEAKSIEAAFKCASEVLSSPVKSLTYLYLPQLDQTAHSMGWKSDRWAQLLETLDSEVQRFAEGLRGQQAACLTADHGVVDVTDSKKIFLDEFPQPKGGISLVGGDTRAPMIYLNNEDETQEYASLLTAELGDLAWVVTKTELKETNWYGEMSESISARLSHITVLARSEVAFYHRAFSSPKSMNMVGHHGSITNEEIQVPLLRLGQFA